MQLSAWCTADEEWGADMKAQILHGGFHVTTVKCWLVPQDLEQRYVSDWLLCTYCRTDWTWVMGVWKCICFGDSHRFFFMSPLFNHTRCFVEHKSFFCNNVLLSMCMSWGRSRSQAGYLWRASEHLQPQCCKTLSKYYSLLHCSWSVLNYILQQERFYLIHVI